jgi:hypothetical protein
MCYGDIDHGSDGYYRRWAEEQDAKHEEDRREEERQIEQQQDEANGG